MSSCSQRRESSSGSIGRAFPSTIPPRLHTVLKMQATKCEVWGEGIFLVCGKQAQLPCQLFLDPRAIRVSWLAPPCTPLGSAVLRVLSQTLEVPLCAPGHPMCSEKKPQSAWFWRPRKFSDMF